LSPAPSLAGPDLYHQTGGSLESRALHLYGNRGGPRPPGKPRRSFHHPRRSPQSMRSLSHRLILINAKLPRLCLQLLDQERRVACKRCRPERGPGDSPWCDCGKVWPLLSRLLMVYKQLPSCAAYQVWPWPRRGLPLAASQWRPLVLIPMSWHASSQWCFRF